MKLVRQTVKLVRQIVKLVRPVKPVSFTAVMVVPKSAQRTPAPYNHAKLVLHTAKLVPQAIRSTSGVVAQATRVTPSHRTDSARLTVRRSASKRRLSQCAVRLA